METWATKFQKSSINVMHKNFILYMENSRAFPQNKGKLMRCTITLNFPGSNRSETLLKAFVA